MIYHYKHKTQANYVNIRAIHCSYLYSPVSLQWTQSAPHDVYGDGDGSSFYPEHIAMRNLIVYSYTAYGVYGCNQAMSTVVLDVYIRTTSHASNRVRADDKCKVLILIDLCSYSGAEFCMNACV